MTSLCTESACLFKATHNLHWQDITTGTHEKRPLCFKHSKQWRDLIKTATKRPVEFALKFGQVKQESIAGAKVKKIRGR